MIVTAGMLPALLRQRLCRRPVEAIRALNQSAGDE